MPNYSLKPGRGPSAANAIGGVVAVVFGIFWTVGAFSITRHFDDGFAKVFPFFGFVAIIAGIGTIVVNTHNATQPNRFSLMDVVPSDTEPDPLDALRARAPTAPAGPPADTPADAFCTRCGGPLHADDQFCARCGQAVSRDAE